MCHNGFVDGTSRQKYTYTIKRSFYMFLSGELVLKYFLYIHVLTDSTIKADCATRVCKMNDEI